MDSEVRSERFRPLEDALETLRELLRESEPAVDDPQVYEAFELVRFRVDVFAGLLRASQDQLIAQSTVDEGKRALEAINQQMTAYAQGGNVNSLTAAGTHSEALLKQLPFLRPATPPVEVESIRESANRLQAYADSLLARVGDMREQADAEMKELRQHVSELERRVEENQSSLAAQRTRIEETVTMFQKQFSQGEQQRLTLSEEAGQKREEASTKQREDASGKLQTLVAEAGDRLDLVVADLHSTSSESIEELKERRREALELVQVASGIVVTGDYSKNADREGKAADRFRGRALAFMAAAILGSIYTVFLATLMTELDWKITIIRIVTSLAATIPAFYCARESSRHRQQERRYRKMELELTAIDPYLALLPTEQRDRLKASLADRFFAQPEAPMELEKEVGTGQVWDLLRKVVETIVRK